MPELHLYPALEDALRNGVVLGCHVTSVPDGFTRVVSMYCGKDMIAIGAAKSVEEAFQAAEQDYLTGSPLARKFAEGHRYDCVVRQLCPPGSRVAASELDTHVLDGHSFCVKLWQSQFRFVCEWYRAANVSLEVLRQLIAERVPSRWRHGEFVWDVIPQQSQKTGEWKTARIKSVSKPAGSRDPYPREKRRVEITKPSLIMILKAAPELLSAAGEEDEQWRRRTTRCT